MFITIKTCVIVLAISIAWVLQVLLSIKSEEYTDYEWADLKKALVEQANRLIKLLFSLFVAWVGRNIYVMGHQLSFLVWLVRAYAVYLTITQGIGAIISIRDIKETAGRRLGLSFLFVFIPALLVTLSV